MKKQKRFILGFSLLVAFALFTAAVLKVDVRPIAPDGSPVGFATINCAFHRLTGVHMSLYTLTDWLGLVPIGVAFGFALLGLCQLLKRKRFSRVDFSIRVLGAFYLFVLSAYILFEMFPVNVRPVLIDGRAQASYPSSTTLLVLCILPSAMTELRARLQNRALRNATRVLLSVFTVFMVVARLLSGVHWLTDIVGGLLLGAGSVTLYRAVSR